MNQTNDWGRKHSAMCDIKPTHDIHIYNLAVNYSPNAKKKFIATLLKMRKKQIQLYLEGVHCGGWGI